MALNILLTLRAINCLTTKTQQHKNTSRLETHGKAAAARQAQRMHPSDRIVTSAASVKILAMIAFHFVHTTGVLWVHSALFVPGDLDLWLLTLTFKVVAAKDQTDLPCEFGTNPFSGSRHPLLNTSPKNRTRFTDFVHLAHKWSPNDHHNLQS